MLGANLRDIDFPRLIQRVQEQAQFAAELQRQIGTLRAQFAALTDVAARGPAEQALTRATAAFNEGRLDDADREFAALEGLRRSGIRDGARRVDRRGGIAGGRAELRLDYDAAEALRLAAAREERNLSIARQWRLVMGAAEARFQQGELRGDGAAFERAILLYREQVLPLAPRSEHSLRWALSERGLCETLAFLGSLDSGSSRLEEAISECRLAVAEPALVADRAEWAATQASLASALYLSGERQVSVARIVEAAAAYRSILSPDIRSAAPVAWAGAHRTGKCACPNCKSWRRRPT